MTRRRRLAIIITCLGLGLVAVASKPVAILMGIEPLIAVYRYESSDGMFEETESPQKGRDFAIVASSFRRYASEKDAPSCRLFRTFPKQGWRYWSWLEYATHPRWRLPYRPQIVAADEPGL